MEATCKTNGEQEAESSKCLHACAKAASTATASHVTEPNKHRYIHTETVFHSSTTAKVLFLIAENLVLIYRILILEVKKASIM